MNRDVLMQTKHICPKWANSNLNVIESAQHRKLFGILQQKLYFVIVGKQTWKFVSLNEPRDQSTTDFGQ